MAEGITPELWRHGKKKKFCAVNSILENKKSFIPVDLEINLPYADIFEHLKKNIKKEFFNLEEIGNLKNKISRIKEKTMQKKFSGHVGINPFVIVGILNSMLSKDDILISDVGLHKQIVSLYYEAKKPRTFFCSNGLGSMGFGLPAAIGAKRTFPRKRVIAVCGDAGFHLSSPELETSVRYRLPIICVVFCDNSVGLIRHYQKKGFKKFNPAITNFGRVDFVKLAQANGCRGHRVKSENNFRNILSNILDTDITTVIEIPLERQTYLW
jgi:acetolactate synthase-1/2/3 large subunit/N2-(2-carboxyethyl)arginine synthase